MSPPGSPVPAVSVIVSNLNGKKFLPKLLETLRGQRGLKLQIIVVDRLSYDGSQEYLLEQPDVTVVSEPPQSGLVSGYAAGVPSAHHDLLFFCNEDMWFDSDCLQRLVERIDLREGVVAADPWQWTYDAQHLIHGRIRFRSCRWSWTCPYPQCSYNYTEPAAAIGEFTPFACAGAVMIHRAAYDAAGGWDRAFFLDHEDVDLFIRFWQLGWRCANVPDAKVYHAVGTSNTQQIVTINTPVKKKRFISGTASKSIIGVKYFNGIAMLLPFAILFAALGKDLLRLRLRQAWLTALGMWEFGRRLRAALRFRGSWSAQRRRRPGQRYFTAAEFEAK